MSSWRVTHKNVARTGLDKVVKIALGSRHNAGKARPNNFNWSKTILSSNEYQYNTEEEEPWRQMHWKIKLGSDPSVLC